MSVLLQRATYFPPGRGYYLLFSERRYPSWARGWTHCGGSLSVPKKHCTHLDNGRLLLEGTFGISSAIYQTPLTYRNRLGLGHLVVHAFGTYGLLAEEGREPGV